MFNKYLSLLILCLSLPALAYDNGEVFCEKNPILGSSRLHQVFDSDFPNERILIHSYTKTNIDNKKPTILFFSGGPGASPRGSEFILEGYNIIFFEQRGLGCSKPDTVSTFLNPKFYSSEKIVSDAFKIIKDYDLKKIIVYGHSYGTVLGTVFASKYPELVEKVVLEGVIGVGNQGIWRSERRRQLLQKTFLELSDLIREKILYYSRHPLVPNTWFSVIGMMMSYLDNGYETYKNFLENIFEMNEEDLISFINNFYSTKGLSNTSIPMEDALDGEVTFGMITCQELSGTNPTSSMNMYFDQDDQLVWDDDNFTKRNYCLPLKIPSNLANFIDLKYYPVNVPVIYLIGENDGATDLEQARYHVKNVPQKIYSFYLLEKGGHLPNLGPLKDNRECRNKDDCDSMKGVKAQVMFFTKILESENHLSPEEILFLNQNLEHKWQVDFKIH